MSDLYLRLAELPSYASVRFISSDGTPFQDNKLILGTPYYNLLPLVELSVTSSIANHEKKEKKSFSKSVYLSPQSKTSEYVDSDSIKATLIAPSKTRRAVLTQIDDKDAPGGNRRFVEVWNGEKLEASRDVTEDHGEFYPDDFYRSLSFSPSENALVYTAEANDPGPTPSDPYAAFRYTPPLGEGFSGKKRPALHIFRWQHDSNASPPTLNSVSLVQNPLLPTLFGQAAFVDDKTLVATGYEQTPEGRLLGIKFCQNRPAGIYLLERATEDEKYNATRLTPPERSCRSPRISPDRRYIYHLSNSLLGAHASCGVLHEYSLEEKRSRIVVDIVLSPSEKDRNGFPGLYLDQLPVQPFISLPNDDGLYIVAHSTWRSKQALLFISVSDGHVTELTSDGIHNWTVLTTDGLQTLVCSRCSINKPSELVVGTITTSAAVTWKTVDVPPLSQSIKEKLASLQISNLTIPGREPTETTIVRHNSDSGSSAILPCITVVHGGPHSTSTQSFNAAIISQALDGYTVSLPNYTGSLGFGEDNVRKLIGQCGTLDIEDCMESVQHLIKLGISEEGPGKQFLLGGSHGGFILGHLIARYPNFFSAAVIRNPVISVGEMSASDIPDWSHSEFGFPFNPRTLVTPQTFKELQAASPINYVDKVQTPVLLMIGGADNRVVPSQGINYYHALKGRSKRVEVLCFKKDSHPLEGVEASRIVYEAGRDWILQARREVGLT